MTKTRPLRKRILDRLALAIGIPLVFVMFRCLCWTIRWREEGNCRPFYDSVRKQGQGYILAFWHGDSFYMAREMSKVFPYGKFYIMASRSRDGALMSRFLRLCGALTARGSSSRGGGGALREMIRVIGPNDFGTMAVDAPRGPRHRVNKKGILKLAAHTGLPIVPLTGRADRKWVVSSWDRTEVPRPFTTATVVYGQPLEVPRDADEKELEALRVELERRLRAQKGEDEWSVNESPAS